MTDLFLLPQPEGFRNTHYIQQQNIMAITYQQDTDHAYQSLYEEFVQVLVL